MKVIITSDVNESYREIVEGLKSKYSQIIFSQISELKKHCYDELSTSVKNNLNVLFKETFDLKEYYEKEKKLFYCGNDYRDAQARLVELKTAVANCDDITQKQTLNNQFSKAMDRISTLNVTIDNRLKGCKEKIDVNIEIIKQIMNSDSGLFTEVKNSFLKEIDTIIKDGIMEFNEELKTIKEQFGKDTNELELPFDENVVKLQIELFPVEIDDFQNKKFIVSTNSNNIKN